MMNPNYMPPGNNNTPNNPLGYLPPSQDLNGLNNYSQMPMPKPLDQDMAQKMQNMNINGPQGFPTIPSSQLPPGQLPPGAFPPTSNIGPAPPTQRPPNQQQFPTMGPKPPGQPPSPRFNQPPTSQTPNLDHNNQFQQPPTSMGPPRPGQPPLNQGHGQPPSSQPQPPMSRPGVHPTPGQFPKPGGQPLIPGQPGVQHPPPSSQPGLPPSQPMPLQSQQPPTSQAMFPPQPPQQRQGLPPQSQSQPGLQPQQGMPPQPNQLRSQGLPPQPGTLSSQPGLPSQLNQQQNHGAPQPGQPGLPPQNQLGQPGLPPQNQLGQPGLLPQNQLGQPGLPPQNQLSQPGLPPQNQSGQPGMPPKPIQQQGQMPQPGQQPPQNQLHQPGLPPKPNQMPGQGMPPMPPHSGAGPQGFPQSGFPPHSQQVGLPQQQTGLPPSQYNQYQQMPGLPHMPPPQSQQRQYPAPPSMQPQQQQQFVQPPGPPNSGYGGAMPPQPQQPYPQSGYPPQYQGQFPAQQPSYPGQQFPQQKKLDPDQMPSPIQVMAEDQANRGGVFVTNEKGQVPPLVTTDFVVDDKGNASPRYIRSSMYSVPATADLLKQTAMPFCVVISPMAETVGSELEPPLLDFAALTGSPTMGPVRCTRCKAYMCPNMKFIDAGRHFKCAFCKATTEVPMEYTQYINSMQQYGRVPAEMALGTYEIIATKEYCRNNTLPNPPAIVFLIDVSYNSVKSGMLDTVCENIIGIIEALPKNEQTGKSYTRIGFITYSSTVHFYNIKGTLAQPQMLSVGDVSDMFVPILEGFLETLEDSGALMQQLMEQLPNMFRDNKETETILLPAVQAGLEALKAADTSGQLIVFHTTLPTFNAPGKLINREDRKLLGTDKEKQILAPQTTAYNELGQSCCAAGVAVELFVCNNAFVDAATIGQLPRLTGGQLHKYTYFTCESDGARLVADVARVVTRATAHDAVMRVRTSTGVRATDFYGHLFMSNTTDVELAAVDPDKAIGIEIKHDDKLTAEDGVYVQAALLYTHRDGSRRLRILNLALAVAPQLADVYRSADTHTIVNFLFKQAVWNLRELSSRQLREALGARCARSLAAYRRHCASPSSAGQLVLPESMKLLPLYCSCVLRHDALSAGPDITCDERACAMYRALTADVLTSLVQLYPRLLELHSLRSPRDLPPAQLRASADKLQPNGVYLLENGVHMLLWVGSAADPEYLQAVFGVSSPAALDTGVTSLSGTGHPASDALLAVLEDARVARRSYMRFGLIIQGDKTEGVFRKILVEDAASDGVSYVEYLMTIHRAVQKLL